MNKVIRVTDDGFDAGRFDVLIVTAIEEEAAAVRQHLKRWPATIGSSTRAATAHGVQIWNAETDQGTVRIAVKCLHSAGNANAGIETSFLLRHLSAKLVMFCGIAGSIDPERYPLGSVVVSNRIDWKGFDKISGDEHLSKQMRKVSLHPHPVGELIVSNFRKLIDDDNEEDFIPITDLAHNSQSYESMKAWHETAKTDPELAQDLNGFDVASFVKLKKPKIKIGGVLSWDYVLNDKHTREELKKEDNNICCVEMESGAIAKVLHKLHDIYNVKSEFVAVRGISDLSHKKSDTIWKQIAADMAALVCIVFLKTSLYRIFENLKYDDRI